MGQYRGQTELVCGNHTNGSVEYLKSVLSAFAKLRKASISYIVSFFFSSKFSIPKC